MARPGGLNGRESGVSHDATGHNEGACDLSGAVIGDTAPFDSFDAICGWAASLGYKGGQVSTNDPRMLDLDKAATSQTMRSRAWPRAMVS